MVQQNSSLFLNEASSVNPLPIALCLSHPPTPLSLSCLYVVRVCVCMCVGKSPRNHLGGRTGVGPGLRCPCHSDESHRTHIKPSSCERDLCWAAAFPWLPSEKNEIHWWKKERIINMSVCSAHKGRPVPEKLIYWIPWHFSCGRYVIFMGELLEPLIMLS